MAGFPLLGHQISLITKTDVRYEGIMYHIDAKDQTVCLQNVKFFGTENRRPDNQIPASDEITPMVIFKSSEIKEVQVPERPQPFAQPPGYPPQGPPPGYGPPPGMYGPPPGYPPPGYGYPPGYPPPPYGGGYGGPGQWGPSDSGRPIPAAPQPQPQPQSSAKTSAPQASTGSPALPTPPPVASKPAPVPGSQMVAQASAAAPRPQPAIPSAPAVAALPSPDAKQHHERRQQHHGPRHPAPAPAAVAAAPAAAAAAVGAKSGADAGHQRSLPGVGGFVRTRKGHGEAAVVGSDFDFEKSNALLEKMKLDQEEVTPAAVDPALASIKPAYQKTDFFDSLSRDTRQRDDMSHQREVDAQTFGEMTLASFRRGRGGFRGGRGGHRGYHGRGGDSQGHDGKQHGGGYRGRRDHYQHQPQEH